MDLKKTCKEKYFFKDEPFGTSLLYDNPNLSTKEELKIQSTKFFLEFVLKKASHWKICSWSFKKPNLEDRF